MTVVSHDNGENVGSVSIFVAAGSRNESAQTAGSAHFLKALPFQVSPFMFLGSPFSKSTANFTNVFITREAESLGYQFGSAVCRENVVYNTSFLRERFSRATERLVEVVTGKLRNGMLTPAPAFFDWELRDNAENIAKDIAALKANHQLCTSFCTRVLTNFSIVEGGSWRPLP